MKENREDEKFAVPYKNLVMIVIGFCVIVLGYLLMYGGGTTDPNVFTGSEMFSFRRIVLSPILIILGFAIEVFAILYKPKSCDECN